MAALPPGFTPVTDADIVVMTEQLGRPPRGVVAVARRCRCGAPIVVQTSPRLPDGTPFPTTYYLTHPGATAAVSRLEAAGAMREYNAALVGDAALTAAYQSAHLAYLADRNRLGDVPEIAGVSAGGMPERVKCLHALVAHELARPGTNPIGVDALANMAGEWSPDRCDCGKV